MFPLTFSVFEEFGEGPPGPPVYLLWALCGPPLFGDWAEVPCSLARGTVGEDTAVDPALARVPSLSSTIQDLLGEGPPGQKWFLAITCTICHHLEFWRRGSARFFGAHLFGFWSPGPILGPQCPDFGPGPDLGLGPKYGPRFGPGPKIWAHFWAWAQKMAPILGLGPK